MRCAESLPIQRADAKGSMPQPGSRYMFVIFPHIAVANRAYRLLMQIDMVIGFGTSYPMNWWLLKRGIKEAI
jgi:hypothetical protein